MRVSAYLHVLDYQSWPAVDQNRQVTEYLALFAEPCSFCDPPLNNGLFARTICVIQRRAVVSLPAG